MALSDEQLAEAEKIILAAYERDERDPLANVAFGLLADYKRLQFERDQLLHGARFDAMEDARLGAENERIAALEEENRILRLDSIDQHAQLALMRPIVEAVAREVDDAEDWFCKRCNSRARNLPDNRLELEHELDCIVEQARAALAQSEPVE